MSEQLILKGWLKHGYAYERHETALLDDEPISELLEEITGKVVTVRYFISDKEDTLENIQEQFIRSLFGELEAEHRPRYSEITGYLWTDEELNVGGHDLLSELEVESYGEGKYLYLIVDIHEEN